MCDRPTNLVRVGEGNESNYSCSTDCWRKGCLKKQQSTIQTTNDCTTMKDRDGIVNVSSIEPDMITIILRSISTYEG